MADRLADGRLADLLLDYKSTGHSFDHVARLLWADYGIEATRQTVSVWTKFAEDEHEAASA